MGTRGGGGRVGLGSRNLLYSARRPPPAPPSPGGCSRACRSDLIFARMFLSPFLGHTCRAQSFVSSSAPASVRPPRWLAAQRELGCARHFLYRYTVPIPSVPDPPISPIPLAALAPSLSDSPPVLSRLSVIGPLEH
jgi:hypothetical protein